MSLVNVTAILLKSGTNITSCIGGAMPSGRSLACGSYLCDLIQAITTVAYPYDGIYFHNYNSSALPLLSLNGKRH